MSETFFGAENPSVPQSNDGTPYTLGTRFEPLATGQVTHLRWYCPPDAPDGMVGFYLYRNSDQQVLAFEERSLALNGGTWVEVELAEPITITPGTAYTAAVFTPNRYPSTPGYSWPKASTNGSLLSAAPGGYFNGNFTASYPDTTFNNGNYFADVVFEPSGGAGPAVTVWEGAVERPAAVTVWDGSTEKPATIEIT